MRILTLTLVLMGGILLGGCPKSGPKGPSFSEEDLASKPDANFAMGLARLKTPDKAGVVDYRSARDYFAKAAELGGGAKAHFNAGWAAERFGDTADAERQYRDAVTADPTYERAVISLALMLRENNKAGEAVILYEKFVAQSPNSLDARNDLMAALIDAKQYERAVEIAQDILRRDPKNAKVYRNLSSMYFAQGKLALSQLCAERALELKADDPATLNNMGVALLTQSDESAAIERFKAAIAVDSANFPANMNLGWVALNSGDYALANASFESARKSNATDIDAMMGLAIAKRGVGDHKAAGTLYDQIISAQPKNLTVYYNAATLHEVYTKDYARALKYLQGHIDAHGAASSAEALAKMELVKRAQTEEAARKKAEEERKKAEEERKRRNEETLKKMASVVSTAQAKLERLSSCMDEDASMEVGMMLEQAQMVVDAQDTEMAADIQTLLDGYLPMLDEAEEACAGGSTGDSAPGDSAPGDAAPE